MTGRVNRKQKRRPATREKKGKGRREGKPGDLVKIVEKRSKNHSTSDSCVVPHRSTNEAVHWLTAQIGRDAVLSVSYGRG